MSMRIRRHPPHHRTHTPDHPGAGAITPTASRSRRIPTLFAAIVLVSILSQLVEPPAIATPKPLAEGLMSQGVQQKLWPSIVDVWNPNIEWRDIEPRRGVFRFSIIKNLIHKARASGDVMRLRIYAGRTAPKWTKRRFGKVAVYDPIDGVSAEVPRWWERGYMRAYARLQAKLAKAFDGNRTIRAVTISEPMTIYAEPFIRGLQDRRTRHNLLSTPYTKRKDKRAQIRAVRAHRVWKRTRQILTVNPWQYLNQDGSFGFRVRFTNRVMNICRHNFGRRCILQNNSMRSSWLTDHMPGGYHEMFRHMRKLGSPISFQTAKTSRVGDLSMVLDWYLSMGAHGVELKSGAVDQLTTDQAKTYDAKFSANG
jgi:hypothetical protein